MIDNTPYRTLLNRIALGEGALGVVVGIIQSTYRSHLAFAKFGIMVSTSLGAKSILSRMIHVFTYCAPLKVGGAIVRLVAIKVIQLTFTKTLAIGQWGWVKKGEGDQGVYKHSPRLCTSAKIYRVITFMADAMLQYATLAQHLTAAPVVNVPILGPYAPFVTHLIKGGKPFKMDGFPNFLRSAYITSSHCEPPCRFVVVRPDRGVPAPRRAVFVCT